MFAQLSIDMSPVVEAIGATGAGLLAAGASVIGGALIFFGTYFATGWLVNLWRNFTDDSRGGYYDEEYDDWRD